RCFSASVALSLSLFTACKSLLNKKADAAKPTTNNNSKNSIVSAINAMKDNSMAAAQMVRILNHYLLS
ncbi:unnamed protein product, partial [Oncorhynchus mykiss]